MSYKQVHETFWTAPDVKKYTPNQRYLFIYFITSPHAHYSGLYYLPLVYIQNETGMSVKDIKTGISFLSEKGHVFYDYDREVIFVKSEMLYQLDNIRDGKVLLNEKHILGLKKHFDTLHKSPLIGKFLEIYSYLNIEYTGIDRGIDTPMDTDSVPVPVPFTVPVLDRGMGEDKKKILFGTFVKLTQKEYDHLKQEWGEKKLQLAIDKLDYSLNKGFKCVDHNLTLQNWNRRGFLEEAGNNGQGKTVGKDEVDWDIVRQLNEMGAKHGTDRV